MIGAILLGQIVSMDWGSPPLLTRRDGHEDKSIQLTGGVYAPGGGTVICGGRPGRSGIVEWRGRWTRPFERDAINGIALSPDGRFVAAAGADGIVSLLDARDGSILRRLEGHAAAVLCVAVGPDSATVAGGSADRSIRLWDAATGTLRRAIQNHAEPVNALDFSPDGTRMASASSDRTVRIWDPGNGRLLRIVRDRDAAVLSVAYTSSGDRIAAGFADGGVAVIDAQAGTVVHSLRPLGDAVYALAAGDVIAAADWTGARVTIDPMTGATRPQR
jgi:WD40 repeat protein